MTFIARVRTVWSYGEGSPGLMTTYFGRTDPELGWIAGDAQIAVDRIRDALTPAAGLFAVGQTWTVQSEVDILQDTDGAVVNTFAATSRTGVGTDPNGLGPLPAGLLLRSQTAAFISGRRLVGRTFFVPVGQVAMRAAKPGAGTITLVNAIGTSLLSEGTTQVQPVVWSRPRPATAVGPGRPAGPARAARVGSSAIVVSYSCSPNFVVMTSRRD